MAQIMALVREAAGLSGGFPTRNQLPGKTHDKTKKNQTNSTPPIRLGVSMGTMQGPTRVRPTAMSVEKIKKNSADSDRSERPAASRNDVSVRFGIWTIPYNALAAKVAPRPRGGGTPGAFRVGFLHGFETAEPVLSL